MLWLAFWIPLVRGSRARVARLTAAELAAHPQRGRSRAVDSATASTSPWSTILRHRQAWAFIVAKFLTDPVWWFFLIWLPDYFKKTRGLAIKDSWVTW